MADNLTINIPDAAPIVVPNQGQTVEELRRNLIGMGYTQLETAVATRVDATITFSRPQGGDKGLSR